ncbi:hypothetical protein B0H13DRAFT_2329433 [Mycena leptocephala]|nr:hypothetical protein B0H13DRAFT_2329433 [Mycena leptocephala]
MDAWRRRPGYRIPFEVSRLFMGFNMVVYEDTALLFIGRPAISVFDLRTEAEHEGRVRSSNNLSITAKYNS